MQRQTRYYEIQQLIDNEERPYEFAEMREPAEGGKHLENTDQGVQGEDFLIVSRSLKKQPGNFEISFESCFMEEHLSAFKEKTRNFIESSTKN